MKYIEIIQNVTKIESSLIYSNLPENKQMIALSATYPSYMAAYVTRYMRTATFVRLNIVDPSLRGSICDFLTH